MFLTSKAGGFLSICGVPVFSLSAFVDGMGAGGLLSGAFFPGSRTFGGGVLVESGFDFGDSVWAEAAAKNPKVTKQTKRDFRIGFMDVWTAC
jgi:hypothetical protein